MADPFIHLRARSAYSLLQSALHVGDLAKLCAGHDMPALALTDSNNLFGALEFSEKLVGVGVQQLVQAGKDNGGRDNVSGMLVWVAEPFAVARGWLARFKALFR